MPEEEDLIERACTYLLEHCYPDGRSSNEKRINYTEKGCNFGIERQRSLLHEDHRVTERFFWELLKTWNVW